MSDFGELFDALDMEFWCDREGVEHKLSRGTSGMQLNIKRCPVCHDARWRVYLNAELGRGNCFVCNETFRKGKFIQAYLDLNWGEVKRNVKEALAEQGWRPKRTVSNAVELGEVKLPVSFALPTPEGQNLVYLERRGITGEMARYFHLRYCDMGWWRYTKDDGTPSGQNFGERVIIPVFDLDGKLVTFQGRDVTEKAEMRYLFPKMLPGTGRYLYNGQNAVRAKRVVLGEGAFDVFATKMALDEDPSLRDVVAIGSFGKHLSYGQIDGNDQLGRFLELKKDGLLEVTIMWDGTPDALLAALDAADLLHRTGLIVRIALLPKDTDPNEVAAHIVREAFYKARPYSKRLSVELRLRNPYSQPKK